MIFFCQSHPDQTEEHFKYSVTSKGTHLNSNRKEIVCKECHTPMISTPVEGEYSANYGRYNSMSTADKKASLKARANKANMANRELKRHMDISHLTQ